jgi:hypothetical protein
MQKRPFFPSISAILAVSATIANPLISSHGFSGNSGILAIVGARKTVFLIHHKRGQKTACQKPLNGRRSHGCSRVVSLLGVDPRQLVLCIATLDTNLASGYNIGRPGGAGLTSLEGFDAYPPGRSFFTTAQPAAEVPIGECQILLPVIGRDVVPVGAEVATIEVTDGMVCQKHVQHAQACPAEQLVHGLSSGNVNRPNRNLDMMSGPADGYDYFLV